MSKPALINVNIGTTFKGAIDNVNKIRNIVEENNIISYIHCDAALFGGYLSYL